MDFSSMLSNLKRKADITATSERRGTGSTKRTKLETETPSSLSNTTNSSVSKEMKRRRPFPKQKVEKIFLVCPPYVQTGGPEAMHQLCNKINAKSDVPAYMLYLEDRRGRAVHAKNVVPLDAYSIYPNIKVCNDWNDEIARFDVAANANPNGEYSSSLVIWPECWTNLIDSLEGRHQNSIWWLSVDNNNGKFSEWERTDILHLHQSEYARCHIVNNLKKASVSETTNEDEGARTRSNLRVLPMTEYIPERCHSSELKGLKRDLDILYNPFKGIHYTDEIRKRSDTKFPFTPIGGGGEKRISPKEVTKLLHRAKVYIDFGPHPGMDRLPREAAIANCIVITNRDGAAFHQKDVPIPDVYKISDFCVESIHQLLRKSIGNYEEKKQDFDSYRNWITSQESIMESCIKGMIKSTVTERSK